MTDVVAEQHRAVPRIDRDGAVEDCGYGVVVSLRPDVRTLSDAWLIEFARASRERAKQWTERARLTPWPLAGKYRETAQMAVYAAYEADQLRRERLYQAFAAEERGT